MYYFYLKFMFFCLDCLIERLQVSLFRNQFFRLEINASPWTVESFRLIDSTRRQQQLLVTTIITEAFTMYRSDFEARGWHLDGDVVTVCCCWL